jgi:hypothetical protein
MSKGTKRLKQLARKREAKRIRYTKSGGMSKYAQKKEQQRRGRFSPRSPFHSVRVED